MLDTIRPGGTIGILGRGAMSQLLALAARGMGYQARLLETARGRGPATGSGDSVIRATPHDLAVAAELARECDVVTVASEDVSRDVLESAARHAPVRPGPVQVAIAQERRAEREWLERAGVTLTPWCLAGTRDELVAATAQLGRACYVKPRVRRRAELRPLLVTSTREAEAAWIALRGMPTIVEAVVSIDVELSVLVARGIDGSVEAFPPAVSVREYGELMCSVLPGPVAPQLARKAQELAGYIARKLGVEGLLAVEMFLLADGRLIVNELVPAPHPTFLSADVGCATGQLEQLIRAITGLPLGSTSVARPVASVPIRPASHAPRARPAVERALQVPGTRAFLYHTVGAAGSGVPIGHLCAVGSTPGDAIARAALARSRLVRTTKRGSRDHLSRRTPRGGPRS